MTAAVLIGRDGPEPFAAGAGQIVSNPPLANP